MAIGALYGIVLLLLMPGELVQDSWSTLVGGREIANHGLPHRETLTVMAHGVRWIDQQWLAQILFYEVFRAGGYRLMLLVHVALIASAFGLALVAARHRGASPLSVFLVACTCFFVAPWGWQLRAQSFAPLLFVGVFWLLIADGRAGSRKVFFVLPLLALWANLHGSVALAAVLVALYGLVKVLNRKRRETGKGLALMVLAPLAVLCSPYGLSLVHYYRKLLINPPFRNLIVEWMAPTPRLVTALFYVLAFVTVWLLGRWGRRLSAFECLALLVTLASALSATRNIVWFGLAALVLLPVLVDETRISSATAAHPAVRRALGVTSLAGLAVTLVIVAARPAGWYDHLWPNETAGAAISTAAHDPASRVFASDKYADWLLWRDPKLAGRVAFDIRFELNSGTQLRRLANYFGRIGPNWQAAARGYQVIVLGRDAHEAVRLALRRDPRIRQAYISPDLAVLVRTGKAAR
ncbi:MAG TPA: hypothetical protein VIM18_13960 [Solirubrobacteraceae bacterium]